MKRLLLILPLLLIGCTTVERMSVLSDMELCFALDPVRRVTTEAGRKIIRAEIKERNLDCKGYFWVNDGR